MLTLEQSKVGMADKVEQKIVDEFRRESFLLDKLPFDNAVSPGTGGSTLVYGYQKLLTPSGAQFRGINEEYSKKQAKRKEETAKLAIFGGAFTLDRVIIKTAGAIDELQLQLSEKIKASVNLFHYTAINGDSSKDVKSFNGLAKLLKGSSTEVTCDAAIDLTTSAKVTENFQAFLDEMDNFISTMDGKPHALLMNSKMLTKMKGIARRAGYYSRLEDAFGRGVDGWDNIPMIDLGEYYDGEKTNMCVALDDATGTTDIYAVQFDLIGFHAVSPLGDRIIESKIPDLNNPGVMKDGDVEMVAAVVLKNTKKAGVLKGIKIKATL